MRQRYRNHAKQSHSRYSLKKGKRQTGVHSYFYSFKKKMEEKAEDPVAIEAEKETKEVKKKKISRMKQMRQKEIEAKKKREKKVKKAKAKLEKAKTQYALMKTDYNDNSVDIKNQIKQLKVEQKNQKKALKEAKKQFKETKKEVKETSKKHNGVITSILITLFFGIGVLLLAVVLWLVRTWPNLKMDELMYEATAPLEGTGSNMIVAFVQQAVVPMVIALVLAIVLIVILTRAGKLFRRIGKSILVIASCVCIGIAGTTFWNHLDVGTYVENQTTESEFIEKEYADPSEVNLTFPETKRNLIYIYLESMEMSYADKANGGSKDENVIPRLTALAEENEDFSGSDNSILNGGYSMPSTTWTMGGIFAATAGLPLQTDVGRNTMTTQSTFFPGITTIGDILEQEGYTNIFACGSPATFGGRQLYFEEHGSYTMHDYNYASEYGVIPYGYYVWWGFEDDRLIEMAKNDLTNLAASGQPFNYTMLTADTHFEDGYLDDGAEWKFDDVYSNVIFHSDKEVSEFVSWCQQQSWYENTTIVISGDHPTMDSDYMLDIDEDYQRRVYTCYINSAVTTENTSERTFTTFDNFPTTLAALGVEIEGDRLGLGTNLFSSRQTLTEEYGLEKERSELNKKSTFMSNLSGNDVSTDEFQEYLSEEDIRSSSVYVEDYDSETNQVTLGIDDIFYTGGNVDYVSVTVTHPDGSSQIVNASQDTDNGSYNAVIDCSNGGADNQTISVDAHVRINDTDALTKHNIYSYSGNLFALSSGDFTPEHLLHTLNCLDQRRYAIFFTTQGDAWSKLTQRSKNELITLGIPESFFDEDENTRYAVFSKGTTVLKEGTGSIRDSGTLANGTSYTISSTDSSGSYATITVGDSWGNLTDYSDGIHIVVYDMQAGTTLMACDFDTVEPYGTAELYAEYDEETKTITFHADEAANMAGGQLDVEVVLWDANDISNKQEIGLSSSNNIDFTVTVDQDEMDLEHVYAVCYLRSRQTNWYRVDEGIVSDLIEKGSSIIAANAATETIEEQTVQEVQE